jgi:AbrB family transcriptional regulator, transcriptional pleiotropic regulator of transition state genes
MKESGIVRNVDNVGRIVLPMEIRKVMSIKEGDPVEIIKENNQIILRKYHKGCIFCGNEKGIKEFKGMNVCTECKISLVEG